MRGANQLFYTQIDDSLPKMDPANVRVTSNAIAALPIDTRVQKAADDFKKGLFKTKKAAADAWDAPYHSVRSRIVQLTAINLLGFLSLQSTTIKITTLRDQKVTLESVQFDSGGPNVHDQRDVA